MDDRLTASSSGLVRIIRVDVVTEAQFPTTEEELDTVAGASRAYNLNEGRRYPDDVFVAVNEFGFPVSELPVSYKGNHHITA